MAKIKFRNMRQFKRNVADYGAQVKRKPIDIAQRIAPMAEAQAKENAPWTDQTANARQSLSGQWEEIRKGARVVLAGQMEYSVFLELRYGGRYAIIMRTLEALHPETQRLMRGRR